MMTTAGQTEALCTRSSEDSASSTVASALAMETTAGATSTVSTTTVVTLTWSSTSWFYTMTRTSTHVDEHDGDDVIPATTTTRRVSSIGTLTSISATPEASTTTSLTTLASIVWLSLHDPLNFVRSA